MTTAKLTQEIKDWFGDGEADVDLMLRLGVVTEDFILALWMRETQGKDSTNGNA